VYCKVDGRYVNGEKYWMGFLRLDEEYRAFRVVMGILMGTLVDVKAIPELSRIRK
jgi:hypothetical protein